MKTNRKIRSKARRNYSIDNTKILDLSKKAKTREITIGEGFYFQIEESILPYTRPELDVDKVSREIKELYEKTRQDRTSLQR